MRGFILAIFLFCWSDLSLAVLPEERLADPAGEERARALSAQLRCLVCQNQSIDDSDAAFAKDLRLLIRTHIKNGQSDDEIIAFLRQRYGDYVLLNPPLNAMTIYLWAAPFAFLILGVGGIILTRFTRRKAKNKGACHDGG